MRAQGCKWCRLIKAARVQVTLVVTVAATMVVMAAHHELDSLCPGAVEEYVVDHPWLWLRSAYHTGHK